MIWFALAGLCILVGGAFFATSAAYKSGRSQGFDEGWKGGCKQGVQMALQHMQVPEEEIETVLSTMAARWEAIEG